MFFARVTAEVDEIDKPTDEDVSSENAKYIREVEDVSHGGAIPTKWLMLGASGVSFQAFTLYSLLFTLYSLIFTLYSSLCTLYSLALYFLTLCSLLLTLYS